MNELFGSLSLIMVLFIVLLIVKRVVNKEFCVLCVAVTLSWLVLLALYMFGLFENVLIVALLMGHTSLGIYYLLEKKVPRGLLVFRVPYLLTGIAVVSVLLNPSLYGGALVLFLFLVWSVFMVGYMYRSKPGCKKIVQKIIECCGSW